MSNSWKSLLLTLPLALLSACAEDDGNKDQSGEIYDHDPNPLPSPEGVDISVDPNEYPTYHLSSLQKPYEDAAGCHAFAAAKGDTSDRTSCLCEHCLENIQECDALQGCGEIQACSLENGCNDEYSCYLLPSAKCVDVINRWGNASVAVSVSLEVLDCSKLNKCQ